MTTEAQRADRKAKKHEAIVRTALKLFAEQGFYSTTIPEIAREMAMSVGNLYNYFPSKETLAQEIIREISSYLGKRIRNINDTELPVQEKIHRIVEIYFETARKNPEMIDFFLRVYLSNREVFHEGCEGMICVNEFVTEIMIFFDDGVANGELKNQDFFSAFGLFMGYLGGMVFLNGEQILPKPLEDYIDEISENIYNALRAG